jgi:hypothetical protein
VIEMEKCTICLPPENLVMEYISSSLLVLQLYVYLGTLHGSVTLNFSLMESLTPRPMPNMEDPGLHFVWPLPCDLSDMGDYQEFTLPAA